MCWIQVFARMTTSATSHKARNSPALCSIDSLSPVPISADSLLTVSCHLSLLLAMSQYYYQSSQPHTIRPTTSFCAHRQDHQKQKHDRYLSTYSSAPRPPLTRLPAFSELLQSLRLPATVLSTPSALTVESSDSRVNPQSTYHPFKAPPHMLKSSGAWSETLKVARLPGEESEREELRLSSLSARHRQSSVYPGNSISARLNGFTERLVSADL